MRKCSIEGCDREHYARDLCFNHYRKLRREGLPPLKPKEIRLCTVPGCNFPHSAKGLCLLHYQREYSQRPERRAKRREKYINSILRELNSVRES